MSLRYCSYGHCLGDAYHQKRLGDGSDGLGGQVEILSYEYSVSILAEK